MADVPPICEQLAFEAGATIEPGQNEASSSDVDALQDTWAFSARSDGAKQYGYSPTPLEPPMIMKVPRRSTRGQP